MEWNPYPTVSVGGLAEAAGGAFARLTGRLMPSMRALERLSSTPHATDGSDPPRLRLTHPFHSVGRAEFEFVKRRKNWQLDRVYYFDAVGELAMVPDPGRRRDDVKSSVGKVSSRGRGRG